MPEVGESVQKRCFFCVNGVAELVVLSGFCFTGISWTMAHRSAVRFALGRTCGCASPNDCAVEHDDSAGIFASETSGFFCDTASFREEPLFCRWHGGAPFQRSRWGHPCIVSAVRQGFFRNIRVEERVKMRYNEKIWRARDLRLRHWGL